MSTLSRYLLTISAGCLFVLAAGSASAQQGCQTDSDCATGQTCIMTPCAAPACDPDDDPNCDPMPCLSEGFCEDNIRSACSKDADCPTGFACQAVGGTDCASSPPCLPGETCPDPLPCESETFYACVPGPCSQDADCGSGLVCVTFTDTICQGSSGACGPGENCTDPAPSEPSCEDVSTSFCAPPYIAPCTVDSDCGEGFLCKPEQNCSCSGGGSTPTDPAAPDGGGSADSECSCAPTGENYCEAEQLSCKTDAECPDEWSCESSLNVAVPCTFDPQTGVSECLPPVESETYCVPPNWGVWGTNGASYEDAVDRAQSGEAPMQPLTVQDSGGCAVSPAADEATSGALLLLLLGCFLALRRRARR